MVASPVSLRLNAEMTEKVRAMAAIEHRSFAEMVRVLTEEAIKTREFPRIGFVNGPAGRRARFSNGLDVWEYLEPYLVAGRDWEVLQKSYPDADEETLREAIRYYQSYPEEIEARVALNRGP